MGDTRQVSCIHEQGKPFDVQCKTCRISKKKSTLVQRKAKAPGAQSGEAPHGHSARARECFFLSSVQKVGPPFKVKGKMRMEVVMPPSSKAKSK